MQVNDYIKYINSGDNIKIFNISSRVIVPIDAISLNMIVKLIGIKNHSITFYI